METLLIVLVIVMGVLVGALIVLMRHLRTLRASQPHDQLFQLLNQNIQGLHTRLDKNAAVMGERLDRAAEQVMKLSGDLGKVHELGRGLKDFHDFLRAPKLRGNIGEQVLRDLLEQCLPREQIKFQYQFRSGAIVDAIVKTDQGMIPIDAKFPLENFRRYVLASSEQDELALRGDFLKDVRKHVRDIAAKYIQPHEGTVDYAVMYIPNEHIYYELLRNPDDDVIQEAAERRVMIVSPNSFYYFLRILLVAMEGKKIEATSREVLRLFQGMHQDVRRYEEAFQVAQKHVTNAASAMDRAQNEFVKLSTKIDHARAIDLPHEPPKVIS